MLKALKLKRCLIKQIINEIRSSQSLIADYTNQNCLFEVGVSTPELEALKKESGYLYNMLYYVRKFNQTKHKTPEHEEMEEKEVLIKALQDIETDQYDMCSKWEQGFLDSYMEKVNQYGHKAFMSEKQQVIIERILNKIKKVVESEA